MMTYYRPLLTSVNVLCSHLGAQAVFLVAEADILYKIASTMSRP
jgi:hypothetical protein